MNQKNILSFKLELVWWLISIIVVVVVLFPILSKVKEYPFQFVNIVFILLFITLARYIFLLKHTFLANQQILKAILGVLCIPIIFYLISEINYFQTYLDEEGLESIMPNLALDRQGSLINYIRSEVLFFGVGSLITAIIFPVRMLVSIWRLHNRGTI
jgi:hypothetical protein